MRQNRQKKTGRKACLPVDHFYSHNGISVQVTVGNKPWQIPGESAVQSSTALKGNFVCQNAMCYASP